MTPFNLSLLLAAGILAGTTDQVAAATPGSTPYTYSQCQRLKLSDQACHKQIVKAGGVAASIPNSVRKITPRNFRGWSEHERWYRKYVEYRKRTHTRPKPMKDVIRHYPGFPMPIPFYFKYP